MWYNENMEEEKFDYKVENILEYITAVSEIYDDLATDDDEKNDKYKKMLFFRGHGSSEYKLLPSLFREKSKSRGEKRILEDYKHHLPRNINIKGLDFDKNRAEILAEMQHYGIPTRLLDWSLSPIIALYFALKGSHEKKEKGKDACVWIFNPWKYYDKTIGEQIRIMQVSLKEELFRIIYTKRLYSDYRSDIEEWKKASDHIKKALIDKLKDKDKQEIKKIQQKIESACKKLIKEKEIGKKTFFKNIDKNKKREDDVKKFIQDGMDKKREGNKKELKHIKEYVKSLGIKEQIINDVFTKLEGEIEKNYEQMDIDVNNILTAYLHSYSYSISSFSLGHALLSSNSRFNVYYTLLSMRGAIERIPEEKVFLKILEYPIGYIPSYQNDRLIHQASVFTIHGTEIDLQLNKQKENYQYLRKITIPGALKTEILKTLHMLFINDYTIFPDFEGMSNQFEITNGLFRYRV